MSLANPVYLLDITGGLIRKLIEYLDAVAVTLGRPPERKSIFPQDYPFNFPQMRVSVQLSEERLRYDEAKQQEMARAAGYWLYTRRSAEQYEEQAKRKVVQDWEKVRGDIYKPNHKRAVILGDPGFGKSWLLRYEGRQLALAEIERLKNSRVGTEDVIIPVFARLSKLAEQPGDLLERLHAVLSEDARINRIPNFTELWPLIARKILSGRALLLLDGWDEVRENKDQLKDAIQAFAEQNLERRIYLTSRIAGYEALSLDKDQTKEWELVSFTNEQVKNFVRSYFHVEQGIQDKPSDRSAKGTALLNLLQQSPQVMGLARIPLMLALLCRIAWEKKPDDKLPTRRVELYEQCLWGLVHKWKYQRQASNKSSGGTRIRQAKRRLLLLSDLSLRLFLENTNTDAWDDLNVADAIKKTRGAPRKDEAIDTWIDELEVDGVLVREGDDKQSKLRFIHRTFQEYLAADAIAHRANLDNGSGWETSRIAANGKQVTIPELIDAKSWDEGWQEVMILLAGKLDQPGKLLRLLQDPETDDKLHHRICLAALCFGELPKARGATLSRLTDEIAMEIFRLWRSEGCLRNIDRPLAQAGTDNSKLIDSLAGLLRDPDSHVRSSAAGALAYCAEAGADISKHIDTLAGLLRDPDSDVRYYAATALGQCAQAGADNTKIIDSLANLLRDPDWRYDAAYGLGECARAGADNTKIVNSLAGLLRDQDSIVRFRAAEALGQCAQAGADNTKLIDLLAGFLRDQDSFVRSRAAMALGQCAQAGADTSKHIDLLAGLLRDPGLGVRYSAATALEQCAQAGADISKHIDLLAGLLRDQESSVRSSAAYALGECAQAGADNTKLIDLLAGFLRDQDSFVRSRAAVALEKLGVRVFEKKQQHYPWKRVKDLARP